MAKDKAGWLYTLRWGKGKGKGKAAPKSVKEVRALLKKTKPAKTPLGLLFKKKD